MIRSWPFLFVRSLASRVASALPETAQASIPFFLKPAPSSVPVDDGEGENPVTLARLRAAAQRDGRRSRIMTPRDSPAMTELESDASGEDGEVELENGNGDGQVDGEGKKKKRGPGKAAGMRRRKLAMKR